MSKKEAQYTEENYKSFKFKETDFVQIYTLS